MSSEESSEEDDERNAALKDALQCTFVQQIFTSISNTSDLNTVAVANKEQKICRGSFEDNIAKVLARRLDSKIEETNFNEDKTKINRKQESGIQLFTTGRIVTSNDLICINNLPTTKRNLLKRKINLSNRTYEKRAAVSAVQPEWVFSKTNTKYWQDNKKPRIINMKTIKTADKGAIICQVLNDG